MVDVASWTRWTTYACVFSMFCLMMSYGPLCTLCLNVFCFLSCTYELLENGLQYHKETRVKECYSIIMFHCAHTKFLQVIMIIQCLWLWVIPLGVTVKSTLKKNCWLNLFTIQVVLTFWIYGGTCLYVVPCKYAANSIDSCGSSCAIKKK